MVQREGAISSFASYATREKAAEEASRIARREQADVVIHDPEGGPEQRISFGTMSPSE